MYAIVTFGAGPRDKIFGHLDDAIRVAYLLPATTTVRIYRCETPELARTADISKIRPGEHIVWTR